MADDGELIINFEGEGDSSSSSSNEESININEVLGDALGNITEEQRNTTESVNNLADAVNNANSDNNDTGDSQPLSDAFNVDLGPIVDAEIATRDALSKGLSDVSGEIANLVAHSQDSQSNFEDELKAISDLMLQSVLATEALAAATRKNSNGNNPRGGNNGKNPLASIVPGNPITSFSRNLGNQVAANVSQKIGGGGARSAGRLAARGAAAAGLSDRSAVLIGRTVTGALGKIAGPIGAVVGAVVGIGVGKAVKAISDLDESITRELNNVNGAVAAASAVAEVEALKATIEQGNAISEQVVSSVKAQSELNVATTRFRTQLFKLIEPFIVAMKKFMTVILNGMTLALTLLSYLKYIIPIWVIAVWIKSWFIDEKEEEENKNSSLFQEQLDRIKEADKVNKNNDGGFARSKRRR